MMENDDIVKYKKRTESNTSKSKFKSNHKHKYNETCLLDDGRFLWIATYCTKCGKIQNTTTPTKINEDGYHTLMNREEILRQYPKLEIKKVKNIWIKYLPISSK